MRWRRRRRVYVDNLPKTHDLRFAVLFVAGFAIVVGGLYLVGYTVAGDKLPSGTTVAGVDLGGMRRDEAGTALQEELAPRLERPLAVTVGGRTFRLDPQVAGLTFDIDATIEEGLGGSKWDPRHMLRVLMGGDPITPVIDVDDSELTQALRPIRRRVEQRPVDSRVSFVGGQPEVTYGRVGLALDQAVARRRLSHALIVGDRSLRIPLADVQPAVTSTEATNFAGGAGRRAVSAPVILRVPDARVAIEPRTFGPSLRVDDTAGRLSLAVDPNALFARTRGEIARLPRHPVNARIVFEAGRPRVRPGSSGITVTREAWARALLRAASRTGAARRATVPVTVESPRWTTGELRRLRVREPVAHTTVTLGPHEIGDVATAARQLNGVLLGPGGTLSLLRRVDAERRQGAASTLASATYNSGFLSGLTTLERSGQRVYQGRFPVGRDARVASPAVDLAMRNDGPYGAYVRAYVDQRGPRAGLLRVEVWGTRHWQVRVATGRRTNVVPPGVRVSRARSCRPRPGGAGFDIDVTRVLLLGGERRRVERVHTRYAPFDAVVCR